MIRRSIDEDRTIICEIINDAALAYRGNIPDDCYHEPYMELDNLESEISGGVEFWGWEESGMLMGIMGIQKAKDVTLIRHAYVRSNSQGKGIGGFLLNFLLSRTRGRILVGTWAAASWAIGLYKRHGFKMTAQTEKDLLLDKYWTISPRQKEASVVLLQDRFSGC
jgi:GNAT superfamily N-acetyltransferase